MKEMMNFMEQEKVDENTQQRVIKHYIYNWKRTGGADPQKILRYVHTALMEDIFVTMYESTLRKITIFADLNKSFFRVIGKYLHELYFLKGETIMRHNDIQNYIYIIYHGQVCKSMKKNFWVVRNSSTSFAAVEFLIPNQINDTSDTRGGK